MAANQHIFGGLWTEQKLEKVTQYLRAYTTALKNQPFELLYIDAFAGTGLSRHQVKRTGFTRIFPTATDDGIG